LDAPHRFVDEQRVGFCRVWRHEHWFRALPDRGTEVHDLVTYAPPSASARSSMVHYRSAAGADFRLPTGASRARPRQPRLDPVIKTALPNVSTTPEGRAFGTQRYQAIIDLMKKRSLRLRDGEGRFPLKLQKGRANKPFRAPSVPQIS
jgi:hypothetical protein